MIDVSIPAVFLVGMLTGAGLAGALIGWVLRDRRDQ